MNFGEAINCLKNGKKVSRHGWNGKRQYIELAENISYTNSRGEIVNGGHETMGNRAIAFVGTSGVQIGWLASQADILSDDWEPVEGIEAAKIHGKHLGRPALVFPENWSAVYTAWRAGEITAKTAMERTGTKRTSFYKLAGMMDSQREQL